MVRLTNLLRRARKVVGRATPTRVICAMWLGILWPAQGIAQLGGSEPYVPGAGNITVEYVTNALASTLRTSVLLGNTCQRVGFFGFEQLGTNFLASAGFTVRTGVFCTQITRVVVQDQDLSDLFAGRYRAVFSAWDTPLVTNDFTAPRPVALRVGLVYRQDALHTNDASLLVGNQKYYYANFSFRELRESEHMVYCRSLAFFPTLQVYDTNTGLFVAQAPNVERQSSVTTRFAASGLGYGLQLGSAAPDQIGPYDIAVFPTLREGVTNQGVLAEDDPADSFRSAQLHFAEDYFLQATHPKVGIRVNADGFTPRLWVWDIAGGGEPTAFRGDGYVANGVVSNATSRIWVVRVSSEGTNVSGAYEIQVDNGAAITSFSPRMGLPGQEVRISTVGLDVANQLTGVSFGGASDALATYDSTLGAVIAHVPEGARSGRIQVSADLAADSSEDFVVFSALSTVRRVPEPGGISFGVRSAASGTINVIDTTTNLAGTVSWQPIHTNVAAGSGIWYYTNLDVAPKAQRFFRARAQ